MLRLCYISSSRILIEVAVIDDIIAVSRRNNRAAGLTGLLVAGQRRFLQLLEGEERAVRKTYQRIRRDPRHFACVVVSERTIDARQFGDWDMGLVRPGCDGDDYAALATLIATMDDPNLRAEFTGFLAINGGHRAAA